MELDPAACKLDVGQVFLSGGKNPQARVSSETPNVILETLQSLKKKNDALLLLKDPSLVILPDPFS